MTAIDSYQRLEMTGLWRAGPDAQRREVVVSLGEASLTLCDPSDRVLTHWSLAAVQRRGAPDALALYFPDGSPEETLEFSEEAAELVEAIERVRGAIAQGRPRPGRLRWVASAVVFSALLAGALFWLPDALTRYAAQILPVQQQDRLGDALLTELTRVSGRTCDAPDATLALQALSHRLFDRQDRIVVLPAMTVPSLSLPGGRIVIDRHVIETWDQPDVVAGYILAEASRQDMAQPMLTMLEALGPVSAARLLVTGNLTTEDLRRYAAIAPDAPTAPVAHADMLPRFRAARVSFAPYANTLTPPRTDLISNDPFPLGGQVVLSDEQWVRLQGLCDG